MIIFNFNSCIKLIINFNQYKGTSYSKLNLKSLLTISLRNSKVIGYSSVSVVEGLFTHILGGLFN